MGAPLAIEDGIAVRLATISGLRVDDDRPTRIIPPHAWAEIEGDDGLLTLSGTDAIYTIGVYLAVPSARSRSAARALLGPYLARSGAQSIWAALDSDPTLDGSVSGILSWQLRQMPVIAIADVEHYGAVWSLKVLAAA